MSEAVERGFQFIESKLREAHQPPGHYHPSMLEEKYISLSKLTSMSAIDLAGLILDNPKDDDYNTYYTWLGDTLAEGSYEQLMQAKTRKQHMDLFERHAYPEIRVERPIADTGWKWRGHADGGVLHLDEEEGGEVRVFTLEHKWRSALSTTDIKTALNQGGVYLSTAMDMLRRSDGEVVLEPAPWEESEHAKEMVLKDGWLPGGVHGCFITAGASEPIYRRQYIDTWEKVDEVLDFYETKALCVIESVEQGSYEPALAWDQKAGLWENLERGPKVTSQEEVDALLDEYDEVKNRIGELETRQETIKKQLEEYLLMEPEEEIVLPDDHRFSKVQIVRSKGRRYVNATVGDLMKEGIDAEDFSLEDLRVKMKVGEAKRWGLENYMGRGKPSSYVRID